MSLGGVKTSNEVDSLKIDEAIERSWFFSTGMESSSLELPQGFITLVQPSSIISIKHEDRDILYDTQTLPSPIRVLWWYPKEYYVPPPRLVPLTPVPVNGEEIRYYHGGSISYGEGNNVDLSNNYVTDFNEFEKMEKEMPGNDFQDNLVSESFVRRLGCHLYPAAISMRINSRTMGLAEVKYKVVVVMHLSGDTSKRWYVLAYVVPDGYILGGAEMLIGSDFIKAYVRVDDRGGEGRRVEYVEQRYE